MTIKLMIVVGTRPKIIKSAMIINEALKRPEIELQIVNTGQHYDYEMSKEFFDELNLLDPIVNLEMGSGTYAWQTGEMVNRLEKPMRSLDPL